MFDKSIIVSIVTVVGSIIGAGGATTIVTGIINRKKTRAEADKIELSGSLDVGRMGLDYAERFKEDLDVMRRQLRELQEKYNKLFEKYQELQLEYNELRASHKRRGDEIAALRAQLELKEDK